MNSSLRWSQVKRSPQQILNAHTETLKISKLLQRIVYYTLQKSIFVLLIVQLEQFIKVTNIKCIIQLKNPQKFSKLINPTFYKSRFFLPAILILFELQIAQVKKNCNELMTLCYSRVNGLITYIFFLFQIQKYLTKDDGLCKN